MNIGEVLSRAWKIIWQYKILWLFGLLASLGGSAGSGSQFNYTFEGNQLHTPFNNLGQIPSWAVVLLVLVGLVLFVLFVILSAAGRAGLVYGAWHADSGETDLTFSPLFNASKTYFWRVILLGLLIFAIGLTLMLILLIPSALAIGVTLGLAAICLVPLICLLVPAFIILSVVVDLAIIAIVGENRGVMESLRRGWAIFRAHLPEMIAMGVIIVIGTAVANFLISLPILPIAAIVAGGLITGSRAVSTGSLIVSLGLFLLYLPILLALRGIITAYVETAWTLTFRRLAGSTPDAVEVPAAPSL